MNGEMAQIVALVGYGNLFLSGEQVDLSGNSTFQYVSAVKFARYKTNRDPRGIEVAASVSDWFSFLRSAGTARLWNVAFSWQRQDIPEHTASGFSGGVPRAIQADLPGGFELWYPLWNTGSPDKNKPWLVEYRGLRVAESFALPAPDMALVKARLRQALEQATSFTHRPDVRAGQWSGVFETCLDLLDSPSPAGPYHPDLIPAAHYSLEARQVLAAASQGDVFGGMGSWNDLWFEPPDAQAAYERVTQALYEAVKSAIVVASNAFEL